MELEIWNKKMSIQRKVNLYARLRDPRQKLYLDYSVTYDENRQKEEERRRLLVRLQVPPGDCAWENMRRGRSLLLEKIWTYDAQQKIVPRFPLTCEADYCRERNKKFEWDCEAERILQEYGVCHAPSNWRRLSIVRELEQCITRRTKEYMQMKETWLTMTGISAERIKERDAFESSEVRSLRWHTMKRLRVHGPSVGL